MQSTSGVKDTYLLFSAKLIALGIGIGTESFMAWFLCPNGRGSYAVCLIFVTLLTVLFGYGVDAAVQYHIASKKTTLSEGVSIGLIFIIIASIIAIIIGGLLLHINLSFFKKASNLSFLIALGYIPINMAFTFLLLVFIAIRNFKWSAILAVVRSSTQLVCLFFFLKILNLGVNGALFAISCGGLIVSFVGIYVLVKKYHFSLLMPSANKFRSVFGYSFRYYFSRLSNLVNFQIGTIVSAFFVSTSDLAFLHVATNLMSRVLLFPDLLSNVLVPRIASDVTGRLDLVTQSLRLLALLCGFVISIIVAISKPVIPIIFSDAFSPMVPIIAIISIGIFLRCISRILMTYYNSTSTYALCSCCPMIS